MIDLTTITVQDFEAYFTRDFPYLPVWSSTQLYNTGARVYYPTTLLFYDCVVNGTIGTVPANVSPWLNTPAAQADSVNNYVQSTDISKAFLQAQVLMNLGLFASDAMAQMAYYYLTAHFLAIDLRAAAGGIAAVGGFPVASRSVGSVSESYNIPKAYTDNPQYANLAQTAYGMKYLSLVLPLLVGNVVAIAGITKP